MNSFSFITKLKFLLKKIPFVMQYWIWIRNAAEPYKPYKRIYDHGLTNHIKTPRKRALLSYIVHPFLVNANNPLFFSHINYWHSIEIVRILNFLGYSVDIIDFRDRNFRPCKIYDLFIGHGGINFEKISNLLPPACIKIYFATGSYWKFHNSQELDRFNDLYYRKGIRLKPDRLITNSEDKPLELSDGIIGIGNQFVKETYNNYKCAHIVSTTALENNYSINHIKDLEAGRKNFLYYAGYGCVHKGLDLLLDSFNDLEESLYICSEIPIEFEKIYTKELNNLANIHKVGWILPRSDDYYDLLDKCDFIIHPSCSEGGPGSVVECMNLGLIPLVSQASGISIESFGYYINPCSIEEIKKLVKTVSSLPIEDLSYLSNRAKEAASSTYSEASFTRNFETALYSIIINKTNDRNKNVQF